MRFNLPCTTFTNHHSHQDPTTNHPHLTLTHTQLTTNTNPHPKPNAPPTPTPLPFPLPLRIGTDICRISRIYDILHTTRRTRFVRRVLAPEELPYVKQKVRTLLGEDVNDEEPVMSGPTTAAAAAGAAASAAEVAAVVAGEDNVTVMRGSGGSSGSSSGPVSFCSSSNQAAGGGNVWKGKDGGAGWKGTGGDSALEAVLATAEGARCMGWRWPDWGIEVDAKKHYDHPQADLYWTAARYLSGRWAAKEAVFKAHPHLRLGFHDVLILTPGQLAQVVPELAEEDMYRRRNLAAPLALIRAGGRRRSQMAEVSISHDIGYATATCIGFEAAPESEGMGWDPSES